MDETVELLDVLLNGVSGPRLKLISEDEAPPLMVLLGLLEDAEQGGATRRRRPRTRMPHGRYVRSDQSSPPRHPHSTAAHRPARR